VFGIVNRLRDRWGTTYVSQSINWEIWANDISQKPTHQRGPIINQPPPHDIIHLVRHSLTDGGALVASVRRDNNIVIAILDDMQKQLKKSKVISLQG
jgi:hypothetical protein